MRHVLRRGVLQRVALGALLVAAAAILPGIARAAVPAGNSINQTTQPSTTWQGQLYAFGAVSDPTFCQSQAVDPGNLVCDHFQLDVQTPGQVEVVVTWPDLVPGDTTDDSDFDLLVCLNAIVDPTPDDNCNGGTEIAYSAEQDPTFERVEFAASAATYEVRVLPFFVMASDYQGCAGFTSAAACPVPGGTGGEVVPATAFFSGCTPDSGAERRIDGHGRVPLSSPPLMAPDDDGADFSMKGERKREHGTNRNKGKVEYKEHGGGARFKSKQVTCATYTDGTSGSGQRGRAEMRGIGKLRPIEHSPERPVCFRVVGEDNGKPGRGRDRFEIEYLELSDNGTPSDPSDDTCGPPVGGNSGTIEDGEIEYRDH